MKAFIPVVIALLFGLCSALEKQPQVYKPAAEIEPRLANVEQAYLQDYIVQLKGDADASKLREIVDDLNKMTADAGAPGFQAHVVEDDVHEDFNMFSVKKPSTEAIEYLKQHALVKNLERDQLAFATGMRPDNIKEAVQKYLRSEKERAANHRDGGNAANFCGENIYQWGLDRVDQRGNTLDCNFFDAEPSSDDGDDVRIYVLDTGLQTDHFEFSLPGANIRTVENKLDFYGTGTLVNNDFDGHGTHVASTAGGLLSGVAKSADILGVKVLDDNGSGAYSTIIQGLRYVFQEKKQNRKVGMVVNMSLGGSISQALNDAVAALANAGIVVVVAAGNSATDACNSSPASATDAITVASSTIAGGLSSFSNTGTCVDVIAPGSDILAACSDLSIGACVGGNFYVGLSGTSMASPHVAGVIALYMKFLTSSNPNANISPPPEIVNRIIDCTSSKGFISGVPANTPNWMAYTPQSDFDQSILDCIAGAS